jgi:hypothetical protein
MLQVVLNIWEKGRRKLGLEWNLDDHRRAIPSLLKVNIIGHRYPLNGEVRWAGTSPQPSSNTV